MANTKYKNQSIHKLVISLIIVLVIVFIGLYFYKWHQVKTQEKYLTSYLVATGTINYELNGIDGLSSVLLEAPSHYFVYVGYTKDEDVYNLEKKLKPLIEEYNLRDSFYYINVTEIKRKKNYKKDLAKKLNISDSMIKDIPVILYFKDGKVVGDSVYNAKDFEKLLKEQDIKSI